MDKTHPQDDQKFSQFVEGIVAKAQAETKCESSHILCDVIRSHIKSWLDQTGDINSLFKVSELIPVGSYAEETKIIQPDEFDYLAIIEELSKPDLIRLDKKECDLKQGLVKVVVVDDELKSKCGGLCKDGHLICFQPINYPRESEKRFGHILIQALSKFAGCSKRIGFLVESPHEIDCKIHLTKVNNASLYFKGAEFRAPNVLIKFEYQTKEVTVDVSPAIRYHYVHDCFREKDCAGQVFAELVLKQKSLLLVGTRSKSDFKVTVTEAEVEYIQRVMKPDHKIIYIFLKYISKLYENMDKSFSSFTSYMIKTVCIHHDIQCKKKKTSIKECLKSVTGDLCVCKQHEYVVSIVNKHIHLKQFLRSSNKPDRECLLDGITTMCQLPTNVEKVGDFDEFLKQIIHKEGQKRSEAAEETERWVQKCQERSRSEFQEMISKIVGMGFEPGEVEKALRNALYDSELAIRILFYERDKKSKERNNKVPGCCSAGQGNPTSNCQTHSDREDGFNRQTHTDREGCITLGTSEESSNAVTLFPVKDVHSWKLPQALSRLPNLQKADASVILYQRQKDV